MSPRQTKRVMKNLDDILQAFSKRLTDDFIDYALEHAPYSDMGWNGRIVYDLAFMLKFYKEREDASH